MTERPILFSGEMVRAILDGRKTQTRRIVKPQPEVVDKEPRYQKNTWAFWSDDVAQYRNGLIVECPYGKPGDRLWVRHDFYKNIAAEDSYNEQIWNPYTKSVHWKVEDNRFENGHPEISDCIPNFECGYWKHTPSIHMPRWASRILLEVVSVRVERLQDIGEEDAKAEGVPFDGKWWLGGKHPIKGNEQCWAMAKQAFEKRWGVIYPGSWEANPWVWVIEFKRVTA